MAINAAAVLGRVRRKEIKVAEHSSYKSMLDTLVNSGSLGMKEIKAARVAHGVLVSYHIKAPEGQLVIGMGLDADFADACERAARSVLRRLYQRGALPDVGESLAASLLARHPLALEDAAEVGQDENLFW
jgi:hypothetical protein